MRWLSTTVLAVLLVGLGAFYYVYEIRQAPEPREGRDRPRTASGRSSRAKTHERSSSGRAASSALHLKRSGDVWSLVAPVAASADRRRGRTGLATSLATLRVEREIEANPQKPADFGLAPPRPR